MRNHKTSKGLRNAIDIVQHQQEAKRAYFSNERANEKAKEWFHRPLYSGYFQKEKK